MARTTPHILDGFLLAYEEQGWISRRVGSASWSAWLAQPGHRLFAYDGLTVRREVPKGKRQAFWYAYRKSAGRVRKVYLGKSTALTAARLAEAAHRLHAQDAADSASDALRAREVVPHA
jgi:hypothetical protein